MLKGTTVPTLNSLCTRAYCPVWYHVVTTRHSVCVSNTWPARVPLCRFHFPATGHLHGAAWSPSWAGMTPVLCIFPLFLRQSCWTVKKCCGQRLSQKNVLLLILIMRLFLPYWCMCFSQIPPINLLKAHLEDLQDAAPACVVIRKTRSCRFNLLSHAHPSMT